jgi:hypothetical protein
VQLGQKIDWQSCERKFGGLVDVNYLDRSATTILAGGSGE